MSHLDQRIAAVAHLSIGFGVIVVLLLIPATAVVGSAGSRSCDRLALFFIAADISGHDPSL